MPVQPQMEAPEYCEPVMPQPCPPMNMVPISPMMPGCANCGHPVQPMPYGQKGHWFAPPPMHHQGHHHYGNMGGTQMHQSKEECVVEPVHHHPPAQTFPSFNHHYQPDHHGNGMMPMPGQNGNGMMPMPGQNGNGMMPFPGQNGMMPMPGNQAGMFHSIQDQFMPRHQEPKANHIWLRVLHWDEKSHAVAIIDLTSRRQNQIGIRKPYNGAYQKIEQN